MARARAVIGGFALLLIAAPASAASLTPSFSLGEMLGPVVAPLEQGAEILDPVIDPEMEVLAPVADPLLEPVSEMLDPITDPVDEVVDPITDPLVDPVEEVVDPILEPVEEVVDPPKGTELPPPGPDNARGDPPTSIDSSQDRFSVVVAGSSAALATSPAASLVSSAVSLLPTSPSDVVLTPSLAESLLSQILDWLGQVNVGSFLAAPFLGLRVLLRALVSAGEGLLVPGTMLVFLAILLARDRRMGTKTP